MKTVDDVNNALDAALEMTFPASDPIAVYIAAPPNQAELPMAETGRKSARVLPEK